MKFNNLLVMDVDQVYTKRFNTQREIKLFYGAIRKTVKLTHSAPGRWN